MKKNVFLILFSLLPVLGFAQGNCHLVDEICQKARQFANSGDTETAPKGLRRAQNDNELRACPGFYKIANLIKEIENRSKTSVTKNGSIWTYTVNGVSFNMVQVDGGTFTMGATSEQESPYNDEKPAHQVTLSSYMIGETEVTQELWQAVMGSNPSYFGGAKHPVEMVSWNDCQEFIKKLNQLTGGHFRLSTEAEWEFAARGGNRSKKTQYAGSSNLGSVAWYVGNSGNTTHDVARKSPNELGLYDMSGNVWEWCQDWYGSYSSSAQTNPTGPSSGSNRVRRGGHWGEIPRACRVAERFYNAPSYRSLNLGLRLAF